MQDRENLINALAASMGVGNYGQTKYESARFDAATGTLYCEGMAISKVTADRAIQYFEQMEKKCSSDTPQGREMRMIYRCGIEAVKMMQRQKIKDVIKEDAEAVQ